MAVVVDTHALVWYLNNDRSLSATATHAIARAEAAGEAVMSVASFIDPLVREPDDGSRPALRGGPDRTTRSQKRVGLQSHGVTATITIESNNIGRAAFRTRGTD